MLIRVNSGSLRCSNRTKEVNQDAATIVSCMKVSREEISLRRIESGELIWTVVTEVYTKIN